MKIALVDDDAACLSEMEKLCHAFAVREQRAVETVRFLSAEAFLAAPPESGFSLVFLDIYMDGLSGVEAARLLREVDSRCLIVFLTSSAEHMPEAFACHAFEYVTKPFTPERIEDVLRDAFRLTPDDASYIEIGTGRRSVRVLLEQIVSVSTDGHYLDIGLTDGRTLRPRMTMAEFLDDTGRDARFLIVNKGVALNAEYISDFENNCCILENGARFPIRLRDKLQIEQAVLDYHFDSLRRQYHQKGDPS